MKKIVIADNHLLSHPHQLDTDRWNSLGGQVFDAACETEQDIVRDCHDVHVLIFVGNDLPVTRAVLDDLKQLQLVQRCGTGFDSVDVEAATEMGIVVANCAGYCREEVAVHALTLMLMCNRQISIYQHAVRQQQWSHIEVDHLHERLSQQTVGLIGLGRIGGTVARMVRPLARRVLVCDPYVAGDVASACGAQLVALDALLRESDLVSLHVPLNEETRGMIGARQLELMKPGAYLVNTARGPIVDQTALLRALVGKRLAGAGLDVVQVEPPSTPLGELFHLPNVVITGHVAASSRAARQDLWRIASENVALVLQGRLPETLVNSQVQPRGPLRRRGT